MNFDLWTLALQSINALVLIWLLKRFLFAPVSRMINERQLAANQLLDKAQGALSQAEEQRNKTQKALADLQKQHDAALERAGVDAATVKNELIGKAQQEVAELLDRAQSDRLKLQQQNDDATRSTATTLALEITEKLLDRLPDTARTTGFIDELVEALNKLSVAERQSLIEDKHPLQLRSARPLSTDQYDRCLQAITHLLGEAVDVDASVNQTLIAGVELVGSHFAVRNSFHADLSRLHAELSDTQVSPG